MFSLRALRGINALRMISVRKFQRLLFGYFITAAILVIMYMIYHANDGQGGALATRDDSPYIAELNDSQASEVLLQKVNTDLEQLQRESQEWPAEGAVIDNLDYEAPPDGHLVIRNSSTIEPDYFYRSMSYTTPLEGADEGVTSDPSKQVNQTGYYELDKEGAVYEQVVDYGDDPDNEIPHILHQTWDTTQVPTQIKGWVRSWAINNPYWVHWFWTDHGFMNMLLRYFPEYYDIYRKYEHNVNKADMRKYFLLYKEGGVIADLDLECVRPFDDAIMDTECILAQEPVVHRELLYKQREFEYITPAFMACRPGHPFFKFLIDNLREYAERAHHLTWEDQVLNATGTMFLSQVYHDYKRIYGADDIYVAPAQLFMPAFDSSYETALRVRCNGYRMNAEFSESQRQICEGLNQIDFQNYRTGSAYTWHHWVKSWTKEHKDTELQDIRIIAPGITIFDR